MSDHDVMERVTIRDAAGGDVPRLRAVFRAASLSNAGDRPALLAHPEVLEFPAEGVGEGRTRAAVVGEELVGFATFLGNEEGLEVEDLFVDPGWMRRGIGSALIRDLVHIAQQRGERRVVVTGNVHAREFYETVGFVTDGDADTQFGPALRMHIDLPHE